MTKTFVKYDNNKEIIFYDVFLKPLIKEQQQL